MKLPDRYRLLAHLDALAGDVPAAGTRRHDDARCAVCVIGLADPALADPALAAPPGGSPDDVLVEVVRRVDRLVRASDLLAQIGPGRLALGMPLAPSAAGALIERVEGAVSMPIRWGAELVSLPASIGVAFHTADQPWEADSAAHLVERAIEDARLRSRRGSTG